MKLSDTTLLDIAQRLALEGKQSCVDGVSREDFFHLLNSLHDTTNPIYLKALGCKAKKVGGVSLYTTIMTSVGFLCLNGQV